MQRPSIDRRLDAVYGRRIAYSPRMPRLRQVPRAEVTSPAVLSMYQRLFGDRDPVAEPGTATGTPGNWWTVFANSPDVLEHAGRGFGLYANPDRKVPGRAPRARPDPRRVARRQPVRVLPALQGVPRLRLLGGEDRGPQGLAGLRPVRARSSGRCSPTPTPSSSAFGRVDDAVFDAMKEHLDDEAIMEFTYITMMYTMHAVITRALRLEYDDRDDPIVEIAAPADYKPANLGRQIAFGMDEATKDE